MIRTIYLIHQTHFDIGFTDLAKEVIQKQVTLIYVQKRIQQKLKGLSASGSLEMAWLK